MCYFFRRFDQKQQQQQKDNKVSDSTSPLQPKLYAHTIAMKLSPDSAKLICVYSNRSIFIWNLRVPISFFIHSYQFI
jgi:hypothetical protein